MIVRPLTRAAHAAVWLFVGVLAIVPGLCMACGTSEAADVEVIDGLRVVHLAGNPYEIGLRHGELLREQVRGTVAQVLGYFRSCLPIPWLRSLTVNWWLDTAWWQATPFLPPDVLEELRGLSDGSGVPLRELYRLHAIPDRTYSCANFAAWGRATAGGHLIHARNLDWNIDAGIQRFATVFVVKPNGKRAFINVGWAGFIGVLSGVNAAQLSIGQVGAETVDATMRGTPMVFVMRRVMEEAGDMDHATAIVRGVTRTVGVNYIVADAKAARAVVMETTRHYFRVFEADDAAEHRVSYARPLVDVVFRADTAVDSQIRDRQVASGGDPTRQGLEPPSGSAYEIRYLGQAAGLLAYYGMLNVDSARDISQAVAPPSNIQSVIVAWPDLWVANAEGRTPAAKTAYHHLDANRLLGADR